MVLDVTFEVLGVLGVLMTSASCGWTIETWVVWYLEIGWLMLAGSISLNLFAVLGNNICLETINQHFHNWAQPRVIMTWHEIRKDKQQQWQVNEMWVKATRCLQS